MANDGGGQAEPSIGGFSGISCGAKFYRADLHIHSYGASPDVKDATMTAEAIVQIASARGIRFVAVADHNEVSAVPTLLAAAEKTGGAVVAIPGVEITTSHGHVLAYCSPDSLYELDRWLKITRFEDDENGGKYTRTPIDQIAQEINAFGGIVIPAHIGNDSTGFMGKSPYREGQAVFESANILAVELEPTYLEWFTSSDSGSGHEVRQDYMAKRRASLGEDARIARLVFSDAHVLERVGCTPDGAERLTRIKMETPSFEGFRVALRDPDARIVLEGDIPEIYPRLVGIRYAGGFLDGQEIAFAPNLTALIGGRGAGKSTAIEALRSACVGSESKISESPAWPSTVQIEYLDGLGNTHLAQCDAGAGGTYEVVDGQAVPVRIPLEGYPQDRIAEIVRGYEADPTLLLDFLDQYVEDEVCAERLESIREELVENGELLLPLEDAPNELKVARARLQSVQTKIQTASSTKAHEALAYRRMLYSERQLRQAISSRLSDLAGEIKELETSVDLDALAREAGISDLSQTSSPTLIIGGENSGDSLKAALEELAQILSDWRQSGQKVMSEYSNRVSALLAAWEGRDKRIEAKIQSIVETLREQGVPTDIKALNNLANEEAEANKAVALQTRREQERKRIASARSRLLRDYKIEQDRRYALRNLLGKKLCDQFHEAGVEFQVGIKFHQGELISEYERWLRSRIGNRFIRGERVSQLCRQLHPIDMANILRTSDTKRLTDLKDGNGKTFLTGSNEAQEFVAALKASPSEVMSLEAIAPDDCPVITLTVERDGNVFVAPFARLSFGQKASILLGILLFSNRSDPLVIDQPEDHLDSAFIYDSVVKTLRRVKERRQVIIATHNANIAVLGDAELIVPLRSWGDRGNVIDRGSVDTVATKKRACKILEGGEQAYRRRGEMYNLGSR